LNPELPMFAGVSAALPKRRSLYASIGSHCIVLAWLLHSPVATFISPSSIQQGENGQAITEIYWAPESSAAEQRTLEKQHLTWTPPVKIKDRHPHPQPVPDKGPEDTAISASKVDSATPTVGSPYGSLSYGAISGLEVRPAIRVFGSEPVLDTDDLAGVTEGNEIIEITIDDQGNIVEKTVIHSLGPIVDARVLAALGDWHFRPATRDGVAIPSKQDVYYHFPIHR
jgi:Gram-negative bacterial TonB protein C-terminal